MRTLLAPVSWIYDFATRVRNWLYDKNIISSWTVNVPTICVGNLTVGGTGKTPHVEFIAEQLSKQYKVAILTRGYKRKSRDFVLATANSTIEQLGDEAMQMHQRFPDIPIAVCEHRVRGIHHLLKLIPDLQVVVLDDGFQHRRLSGGYNILLTPHDNLYVNDHLLPWGTLRENTDGALRANAIVVTKCPLKISPIERRVITSALKPLPFQQLYFSSFEYLDAYPLYPDEAKPLEKSVRPLVVTGIASPKYISEELDSKSIDHRLMSFADHHKFTKNDIIKIEQAYKDNYCNCILTTEKDAVRLMACKHLTPKLKQLIYVLPVRVNMHDLSKNFIKQLIEYVKEGNRKN